MGLFVNPVSFHTSPKMQRWTAEERAERASKLAAFEAAALAHRDVVVAATRQNLSGFIVPSLDNVRDAFLAAEAEHGKVASTCMTGSVKTLRALTVADLYTEYGF